MNEPECECGFVWQVTPAILPGQLRRAVERVRALIPHCPEERHDPTVWSGLEYAGHVRDVLLNLRERMIIGLAVDRPRPDSMFRDFRVDELRLYDNAVPALLSRQLSLAESLFTELTTAMDDEQWARTIWYPWPRETYRSLAWVAANALHEAWHHGDDIEAAVLAANPRLYHFALAQEWERDAALAELTASTRGRTLAEEGFIHLCLESQVAGVAERFYADVLDDVVLLELDTAALRGSLRLDVVHESGEPQVFPHLYSPLPRDAILSAEPYRRSEN